MKHIPRWLHGRRGIIIGSSLLLLLVVAVPVLAAVFPASPQSSSNTPATPQQPAHHVTDTTPSLNDDSSNKTTSSDNNNDSTNTTSTTTDHSRQTPNTTSPSPTPNSSSPNDTQSPSSPTPSDPEPRSIKVIDSTATINDPAWFQKVYNDGFRLYVMHSTAWGTCTPWYNTEKQLGMALAAGLKVAVYTRDPNCWKQGILAAGPYQDELQFFALDIETDPGIPVTHTMVDGVKNMGVRPVIYTGSGMWGGLQGETADDFSDVPLWDTNVSTFDYSDWQVDYLWPAPVVYGGWNTLDNMRIGVQQQFEYNLHGVYVDLNSFNAAFIH